MAKTSYKALVAEAFLEPIRSVLIVDDDYPTLHEILLPESERARDYSEKDWHKSPRSRARVRRVIDQFRRPGAPYMLDIHDGRSPSEETDEQQVGTLQQTDLLILDYILDRSKENDGTASIRIAREALRNKHFNLILVHTNEVLDDIFGSFVLGLLSPCFEAEGEADVDDALAEFLDEHEVALLDSIHGEQYLAARHLYQRESSAALNAALQKGTGPLGRVKAVLEAGGLARGLWLRTLRYGLEAFEVSRADSLADEDLGILDWRDDNIKFIRAARGFICFTKKNREKKNETDLLNAVHDALVAWKPLPSRLLLTKLRAEMNERGIEVQDDALGEHDVGAMWYLRLLQQEEPGLQALINRTVRHHSEQLLDQLLPQVNNFASRIRAIDAKKDAHDAVKERFSLDLNNPDILLRAQAGHNAFIGSKPSTSAHVDLGHILLIDGTYWICATPACDMVPGQNRGTPPDKIPKLKRFTALKLLERKEKKVLEDAHNGGQIFVNLQTEHGVERKAFAVAENYGSSPTSITMYVENDGYFADSQPPQCRVIHVSAKENADGSIVPELAEHIAVACGMLRYEYALEIQSRYVASQGRIGLEFEAHKPEESGEKAE